MAGAATPVSPAGVGCAVSMAFGWNLAGVSGGGGCLLLTDTKQVPGLPHTMLSLCSVLLRSYGSRQETSGAVIMRHSEVDRMVLFHKQDHQSEEMVPRLCFGAQDVTGESREPDQGRCVCKARTGSRSSGSQLGLLLLHLQGVLC